MNFKYSLNEYNSAQQLYSKLKNYNEVARRLNIPSSTIKLWLKTDALPLACSQKFKNSIYKASLAAAKSRTKKLPKNSKKLTSKLAYILGVIEGDGCINGGYPYKNRKSKYYTITLNTIDFDFAISFKRALEEWSKMKASLSNIKPYKSHWSPVWRVVLYSNEAGKFLKQFNIHNISEAGESAKCSFLKGFYDSEGSVYFNSKWKELECTNTDKELMYFIDNLLESIGITKTYWYTDLHREKPCYKLSMHSKKDIQTFKNKVGFSIKRKQERIEKICNAPDMRGKWDRKTRKMAKGML